MPCGLASLARVGEKLFVVRVRPRPRFLDDERRKRRLRSDAPDEPQQIDRCTAILFGREIVWPDLRRLARIGRAGVGIAGRCRMQTESPDRKAGEWIDAAGCRARVPILAADVIDPHHHVGTIERRAAARDRMGGRRGIGHQALARQQVTQTGHPA